MSAIAKLIASIGLNTSEFKKNIGEVKSQTSNLATESFGKLKSAIAGAFTVGAIVGFISKLKDYAGAVQDAAEATGSGTSAVQALNAVAIENASSAEKMKAGLDKIRTAQIDALGGSESARAAFENLGISMEQIEGVGADRVFELIGKSIATAENQATALSAAGDILGNKLITNLTPALMAVGKDGLDPTIAKFKELGLVMDETMLARIDLMGDKWELFKTRVLVVVADISEFLERLGAGIGSALNTDALDTFSRGWNEMAQLQAEAARKAVEATKSSNAGIIQSEQEKYKWVDDKIDYMARHREKAAQDSAAAEIEAAQQSAEAQKKQLDDLIKARDAYYKASSQYAWDSLTPEERLNELYELRNGLLEAIYMQVANNNEESAEYYLLQTKLLEVQGEIEKSARDSGKAQRDQVDKTRNLTRDQVVVLSDLQALLKNMTAAELSQFISKIKELHKAVGALDFSGLLGLQALSGFSIPNESVLNAAQFGRALSEMAKAIGNTDFSKLGGLEVLKGLKIPNESVLNARQFGRALRELVQAIGDEPLDLAPLQKVSDLFAGLTGGQISIQIAAPTRDQLTLLVDDGFKSDLSSLAGSAKTIAGLKGIIYQ